MLLLLPPAGVGRQADCCGGGKPKTAGRSLPATVSQRCLPRRGGLVPGSAVCSGGPHPISACMPSFPGLLLLVGELPQLLATLTGIPERRLGLGCDRCGGGARGPRSKRRRGDGRRGLAASARRSGLAGRCRQRHHCCCQLRAASEGRLGRARALVLIKRRSRSPQPCASGSDTGMHCCAVGRLQSGLQARFSCCLLVLRVPGGPTFEPFEQPVLARRPPCCSRSSKELEAAPDGSLERAGLAVGGGPGCPLLFLQASAIALPAPPEEISLLLQIQKIARHGGNRSSSGQQAASFFLGRQAQLPDAPHTPR